MLAPDGNRDRLLLPRLEVRGPVQARSCRRDPEAAVAARALHVKDRFGGFSARSPLNRKS